MNTVVQGFVLGFSIAAPVGPIGLLVLRQSLRNGVRSGFVCGLGAATADLCYGALTVLGLTLLAAWRQPLSLAGGLLLLWLAWTTWHSRPAQAGSEPGFGATFLLTLSNPMTILSFAAMVAGAASASPALFIAGVFAGSLSWWAFLAGAAGRLSRRARPALLVWLNRLSALVLFGFGVRALLAACRA